MVRFGHTDVVDQTQRACKRGGDGEVGLGKRLVHTGERLSVTATHRIVDGAPERPGEVLDRASRSCVVTSWCGLNQMLEHPTVRRRGLVRLCRVGLAQRALDQTADDSRVDASELIVDLSTRVRGDRAGVEDPREVVQQSGLGLGDAFVAHRQEHGGRACGRCEHARTQMHAPLAPAGDGACQVLEGGGKPARGVDDKLDALVEVAHGQGIDEIGQFGGRLPGQLAREPDDGVVMQQLVIDGIHRSRLVRS